MEHLSEEIIHSPEFVETELKRLFLLGAEHLEDSLALDDLRHVMEALQPLPLESQLKTMIKEAHPEPNTPILTFPEFRSAMGWALSKEKELLQEVVEGNKPREYQESESQKVSTLGLTMSVPTVDNLRTPRDAQSHVASRVEDVAAHTRTVVPAAVKVPSRFNIPTKSSNVRVNMTAWHKAAALSLASNKVNVIRCILNPHEALRVTQGIPSEEEIAVANAAAEKEAKEIAEARRIEELQLSFLHKQQRDRNGRRVIPAAPLERTGQEVYQGDPRQVDRSLLLTGANRANVKAFLAAKALRKQAKPEQHGAAPPINLGVQDVVPATQSGDSEAASASLAVDTSD